MALPTRATSDQACRRLRAFLDRAVNTVGTDLQLVHGSAALSVDHEELEGATGAPRRRWLARSFASAETARGAGPAGTDAAAGTRGGLDQHAGTEEATLNSDATVSFDLTGSE